MLRFKVFENGVPARSMDLKSGYLLGSDRVPLRVALEFAEGEIRCDPRARGAAALSLLWPVEGVGRVMLETTRLPERAEPYNLHVELARGQLLRISQKREEWGLYDFAEGEPVYRQIDAARDLLVAAVTSPDDATAARHGDAAIAAGVRAGEAVGIFHADLFLKRRQSANQLAEGALGCRLDVSLEVEACLQGLADVFDFASVPLGWGVLEPQEGKHRTAAVEQWLRALERRKIPVRGCSLLSFEKAQLPRWVSRLKKNYERVRECASRHIKYVLKKFDERIHSWEVISGVHATNAFELSFEQIMELTRLSAILAKQLAPRSTSIVGMVLPWGEYYAHDPRTIPPLLYAEMVVQGGINFDAFGVEMRFDGEEPGHYVRDMMQLSSMLDRFGSFGKPVHVTATGVPSGGPTAGGCWHGEWSEEVQAKWAREFYQIALSKPFVETVCWQGLADGAQGVRSGGLLRADLSRKPAYDEIVALRRRLLAAPATQAAVESASDDAGP